MWLGGILNHCSVYQCDINVRPCENKLFKNVDSFMMVLKYYNKIFISVY